MLNQATVLSDSERIQHDDMPWFSMTKHVYMSTIEAVFTTAVEGLVVAGKLALGFLAFGLITWAGFKLSSSGARA